MVDYWLDSNVFIEGEKGPYGFNLAPRFWIIVKEMSNDGLLACPSMVYAELHDAQDDLSNWARERKKTGMFIEPDVAVQQEFQKICTYVMERYPDNQPRRRFLDRADPWIIAHALVHGGKVVTHEQRNPETSSKVKIPNVCAHFGVHCIDIYQMLRDQGVSWT